MTLRSITLAAGCWAVVLMPSVLTAQAGIDGEATVVVHF